MFNRYLLGIIFLISACNSNKKAPLPADIENIPQVIIGDTISNFFPVTSYLRGEILGIKTIGITPVKKTIIGNKTDSVYVKETDYETIFAAFLSPIIDTVNLKDIFTEKRFLDQTLGAFTFTYDPTNGQGNKFPFKHWDVYVDPETSKVRRIYLTKKVDDETELLLTWQSGKWCKIITITNSTIIKEEKISWSYEE